MRGMAPDDWLTEENGTECDTFSCGARDGTDVGCGILSVNCVLLLLNAAIISAGVNSRFSVCALLCKL